MNIFKAATGEGRYRMEGIAVMCGQDLQVTVGGGDRFHIGAAALAAPRENHNGVKPLSSASVVCIPHHQEDMLVREGALKLSAALKCNVCVSCGIHSDDLTDEEMDLLSDHFRNVIEQLEAEVKKWISEKA